MDSYASLFFVPEKIFGHQLSKKSKIRLQKIQILLLLCLVFGAQTCSTSGEYWLGIWSGASESNQQNSKYPSIFIVFVFATLILMILRVSSFFTILLNGARSLHDGMLLGVLLSPMMFFESQPIGRVLNRFSKDQFIVDELLPKTAFDALQVIAFCSMAVFAAALASPFVLLLIIPCLLVFSWAIKMFLSSSRVLKRLAATTRSPIFSLFGIIYAGLPSIRAFKQENMMLERGFCMIDINTRISLMFDVISRWLGFTLDMTVACLSFSTAILCISLVKTRSGENSDNSAVGLVLSYMVALSGYIQWAVRQSAELENHMTSTERIVEYKNLPREGGYSQDAQKMEQEIEKRKIENWPNSGKIEIKHLHCKYREHLDFVINDVNITINDQEKIGIVGRTGSGKSSLFLTFFRLLGM